MNFIPTVFLEILQRYCKLLILRTLGRPSYVHQKSYYQLVENVFIVLTCRQKIKFIPHVFLEILQRQTNFLFWLL